MIDRGNLGGRHRAQNGNSGVAFFVSIIIDILHWTSESMLLVDCNPNGPRRRRFAAATGVKPGAGHGAENTGSFRRKRAIIRCYIRIAIVIQSIAIKRRGIKAKQAHGGGCSAAEVSREMECNAMGTRVALRSHRYWIKEQFGSIASWTILLTSRLFPVVPYLPR